MKTPDYETIAYMFARAAEALIEKAQRDQEAKAQPPKVEIEQPVKRKRKFSLSYKGKPKGAKNWSQSEKDHAITVWAQTNSYDDVAANLNRSRVGVRVMIHKLLRSGTYVA